MYFGALAAFGLYFGVRGLINSLRFRKKSSNP
jgi:hypothetical protein